MAEVSKHETIALLFFEAHPTDTVVTPSAFQDWIAHHANGAAIKSDLAIEEPSKRLSALRRHLNEGGRSDGLPEAKRFQLQIEDAKRRTMIVRAHSAVAKDQAVRAISDATNGALGPLKRGQRAIDAVKLDELPEIEREVLEIARANIEAMEKAVKPTLAQEIDRIWVARLAQLGLSPEQARRIREALPEVTKLQKLLKATS